MTLQTKELTNALTSHAMSLGVFERTGTLPVNAPGNGLTYAVWPDRIRPAKSSGLASVSAAVNYFGRIYQPAEAMPHDEIDDSMLGALDALLAAYCGDFDLGGLIRCVDILGMEGTSLGAEAGWVKFDEGPLYRAFTITIPMIINDAWSESA